MYVGPRRSKALRSRRDNPAREISRWPKLGGPALLHQPPAQDGPPEPDARGDDAAAGRGELAPEQLRDLPPRLGPKAHQRRPARGVACR